jgi:glycosyltransferase involved in cell wall biosynthesis
VQSPLVSVAVITYNHSSFVLTGVESVLSSEYPNLEVIVVDDGSTDTTWSILNSIKDNRLRIYTQKNQGPSNALNLAISHCRGDYIFTISADDMMTPSHIKTSLHFLETRKLDIGFSLPNLVDENNKILPDIAYPAFYGRDFSNSDELLASLFFKYNFLCASSAVFKKDIFYKGNFKFDDRNLQLQDFKAWLTLAQTYRIGLNSERTMNYRVLRKIKSLSNEQNDGRMQFEMYLTYRDLMNDMSETALKTLSKDLSAKSLGQASSLGQDLAPQLAKAELCLLHPLRSIQLVGLELIYDFKGELPIPNSKFFAIVQKTDPFKSNKSASLLLTKHLIKKSALDLILKWIRRLFSK